MPPALVWWRYLIGTWKIAVMHRSGSARSHSGSHPTNLLLVDLEAHQVHACTPADAPTPYHTWALDDLHVPEVTETLIPGSSERYEAFAAAQERVEKARRAGHVQLVKS